MRWQTIRRWVLPPISCLIPTTSTELPTDSTGPWRWPCPCARALGREIDYDAPLPSLPADVGQRMRDQEAVLEYPPGDCDGVSPQQFLGIHPERVESIDCCVGLRGDRAMVDRLSTPELITRTRGPGESLGVAHLARIHQVATEVAAQNLEKARNRRPMPIADLVAECRRRIEELRALEKETIDKRLRLIDGALKNVQPNSAEAFDLREKRRRLESSITPSSSDSAAHSSHLFSANESQPEGASLS